MPSALPVLRIPRPGVGRSAAGPVVARRRRACRALAWGLGLFAAAQLGVGVASEVYPRIRDPLYGDKLAKLNRRLAAAADRPATVVMLGSSRTGLAFDGKRVERHLSAELGRPAVAFNFGVPASGPVTHLVYLRRLLAAGVVPDLLVLELLPSMLADGPGAPLEQNWFFADRLTYREQDVVIRHGFPAGKVRDRWAKSALVPASALRFQLMSRVAPSWLPWQLRFDWSRGADECGWGTTQTQEIDAGGRGRGVDRARAEYAGVLATLTPGGPAADALRELLALCRDRGVPVRLVLMPEGTEFRALYPPAAVARLTEFVAGVGAEYGTPVTDAREWLPDADFYDAHHMFAAGAAAFTDRLTAEAIAPHFRARPARGTE